MPHCGVLAASTGLSGAGGCRRPAGARRGGRHGADMIVGAEHYTRRTSQTIPGLFGSPGRLPVANGQVVTGLSPFGVGHPGNMPRAHDALGHPEESSAGRGRSAGFRCRQPRDGPAAYFDAIARAIPATALAKSKRQSAAGLGAWPTPRCSALNRASRPARPLERDLPNLHRGGRTGHGCPGSGATILVRDDAPKKTNRQKCLATC